MFHPFNKVGLLHAHKIPSFFSPSCAKIRHHSYLLIHACGMWMSADILPHFIWQKKHSQGVQTSKTETNTKKKTINNVTRWNGRIC
jgi:hypothetical protein